MSQFDSMVIMICMGALVCIVLEWFHRDDEW